MSKTMIFGRSIATKGCYKLFILAKDNINKNLIVYYPKVGYVVLHVSYVYFYKATSQNLKHIWSE